jgi:dihydroorotase
VTTVAQALAYRQRILAALPAGSDFDPLMTLYLTDTTDPAHMQQAADAGIVACKLYPAGATTNSDSGVTDIRRIDPVLEAMADAGLLLLVHGEVTHTDVDIFDREVRFLDDVLGPLIARHPSLKTVLEHITTAAGVDFVRAHAPQVGGTLTPQHLLLNRNALFAGGLRPHNYCLPVLKREADRTALVAAATSGEAAFFLGTDSAPHARGAKESACGCAGVYSAHAALELYAEVFDAAGALDRLEAFASRNGPRFYGLPENRQRVTLTRRSMPVPEFYPLGDDTLVPFRAGQSVQWRLSDAA